MSSAAPARAAASPSPPRATVLYVEDDAADVALMADFVGGLDDARFVAVSSIDEAIGLARRLAPSAVLLDLDLVEAPGGPDALQRLRALPELRSVLLVGLSGRSHRFAPAASHLGFHRFVAKPIKLAELERTLAAVIPVATG